MPLYPKLIRITHSAIRKIEPKVILGFLLVMGLASQVYGQSKKSLPNILWITSEDNSPLLGCYGDTFATTPNLDQLASEGVVFDQAYATTPVCAPSRFTIITGTYANSRGTLNMRSSYPISEDVQFYPQYLKQAGYYTSNQSKKDYNTPDQPSVWNQSGSKAHFSNRQKDQPFFHITNINTSHESRLHSLKPNLVHDPAQVPIPPYHPDIPEIRYDWAQYYDKVMEMDSEVGAIIQDLKERGLYDKTIIFYYSDHGGVVARSKRYLYESGLHIPFIVRVPEAYQHLFPGYQSGSHTQRMISFVDLAPTLLSIIGTNIPGFMQGIPFMGNQIGKAKTHVIAYADRMDERLDMSRSIRTATHRYTKHFMPKRPAGHYLEYLWKAPSARAWEKAWQDSNCNEVQSQFFLPKPDEELFVIDSDPYNINNLANTPELQGLKDSLSRLLYDRMVLDRDLSIIPEIMRLDSLNLFWYQQIQDDRFPYEELLAAAWKASSRKTLSKRQLRKWLKSSEAFQFWALRHLVLHPHPSYRKLKKQASRSIERGGLSTQIAGIRYWYSIGEKNRAVDLLNEILKHPNSLIRAYALDAAKEFDLAEIVQFREQFQKLSDQPRINYDGRISKRFLEQISDHKE